MQNYIESASFDWSEDSIRYINTPSILAKNTYLYVQEVGYFKTFPTYYTERENLNSYLIVYTISGTGLLKYKAQEYTLKPGDTFYISCMDYQYYSCSGEQWEFLWIHFQGVSASGYYNVFIEPGFRIITPEDCASLEGNMRRILTLTQKKDPNAEVICSNLLNSIITELIIHNSSEHRSLSYMPDYIKSMVKYLDQHFKEEISLKLLAKNYGFSPYYLSREFKKYFGITYSEYLITLRLNYAKELLKYSELSINDITFQIGMNHVSHFINLFKAREELTPLSYRKEWQL
ncbi:MAG: AraC family transcriptional regulator [Herbinix sp.]|jgi:AraC-like DNA-binding protein|nr:AraC family transcriptional regulator [Herbinix sp.]